MAVGGLAVSRRMVRTIARDLSELNRTHGVVSEVKWENAKRRRVSIHQLYVDYLFELIASGSAHLHIRFAPFKRYDHRKSGKRGRIDTVSKMYFQLLLHRPVRYYGRHRALYVFPDDGECTAELPDLRNGLCSLGQKKHNALPNCVKEISPRSSKREPLLQLLDVTLGGVAAIRNDRKLGETKSALAAHIHGKAGFPDLTKSTKSEERRLNFWNVKPMWGSAV